MTERTQERIENMTDHQLYRTIEKVKAEEGTWHDEKGRAAFLERLIAESERRDLGDE